MIDVFNRIGRIYLPNLYNSLITNDFGEQIRRYLKNCKTDKLQNA